MKNRRPFALLTQRLATSIQLFPKTPCHPSSQHQTSYPQASASVALPSRLHPSAFQRHQQSPRGKAKNSRDIVYAVLILDNLPDLVGQLAGHLDGVQAGHVAVEALPLCDPAAVGVRQGDDALEDLGRAGLDLVLGAGEVEEVVAVGAPFVAEALRSLALVARGGMGCLDGEERWDGRRGGEEYAGGLDDGADHAGAEVALLAGRDEGSS